MNMPLRKRVAWKLALLCWALRLDRLGNYFEDVPGIAGSSILGNGRVALILDTPTILRNIETRSEA